MVLLSAIALSLYILCNREGCFFMSENKEEYIVCPNCGNKATDNYCSHCGQSTHLHKETFWGLIGHFLGHYLHFESKFWKSLGALCFHPGKLTLAYWNKQRARYIAPISLYIFISFAFFLSFSALLSKSLAEDINYKPTKDDSLSFARMDTAAVRVNKSLHIKTIKSWFGVDKKKSVTAEERKRERGKKGEEFLHYLPKVFFFMIPLMALVLFLLFFKRRHEINFVDHSIFSLHVQSFVFLLLFASMLDPLEYLDGEIFDTVTSVIETLLFISGFFYLITALKNVYHIRWANASLYAVLISLSYVISFSAIFGIYLIWIVFF